MATHCAYSRKMRLDYEWLEQEAIGTMGTERDLIANTSNMSSLLFHFLNALKNNSINWCGFYLTRPKPHSSDDTATSTSSEGGDETSGSSSSNNNNKSKVVLVLGPFQGKVACKRIEFGTGVCGTAAATKVTQVVADVHEFPGHIACDAASNSEIVVPIIREQDGEVCVRDRAREIVGSMDG